MICLNEKASISPIIDAYIHIPNISSSGAHKPTIKIANENNLVVIYYFTDKVYHQKMYIDAPSGLNKLTYYQGLTTVDEPLRGTSLAEAIKRMHLKVRSPFWCENRLRAVILV